MVSCHTRLWPRNHHPALPQQHKEEENQKQKIYKQQATSTLPNSLKSSGGKTVSVGR